MRPEQEIHNNSNHNQQPNAILLLYSQSQSANMIPSASKRYKLIHVEAKGQLKQSHKRVRSDPTELLQQPENYLNSKIVHQSQSINPASLVAQFNAKLKRSIEERNIALLKSRSRHILNHIDSSTLQTKQKKVEPNLIIMDGQQIKQGHSLDIRVNKNIYAESRHLKSLSSSKQALHRMPLLYLLPHRTQKAQEDVKEKQEQKRAELIRSLINRYNINRETLFSQETEKDSYLGHQMKGPLLAIVKFPTGLSPDNKRNLRRSTDKPAKLKERRQIKQLVVSTKLRTKQPTSKYSAKNMIHQQTNGTPNMPFQGQDISPWLFQQTEFYS